MEATHSKPYRGQKTKDMIVLLRFCNNYHLLWRQQVVPHTHTGVNSVIYSECFAACLCVSGDRWVYLLTAVQRRPFWDSDSGHRSDDKQQHRGVDAHLTTPRNKTDPRFNEKIRKWIFRYQFKNNRTKEQNTQQNAARRLCDFNNFLVFMQISSVYLQEVTARLLHVPWEKTIS